MEIVRRTIAVCLAVMLMAPAASAQQSVIGTSALEQAVQQRVSQEQADRDAITSLLRRAQVRENASKAGLSVEKAEAAVSTLEADDLRELAKQARQAQDDLAGGASTVVISTTTIILILLLIINIVLVAD